MMNETATLSALSAEFADLKRWLHEDALPLWWEIGAQKPEGGFYERIDQKGHPTFNDNRRSRVQPRQAYCYASAGQNGWEGPWQLAVDHGLDWFEKTYRLESGFFGNLADASGRLIDYDFDLYNQAFALLGFSQAAIVYPERFEEIKKNALELFSSLNRSYSHPVAGYEEHIPPREPLRSNPHMHLFEALLAWNAIDPDGPWGNAADDIAELAMTRFIDAESGGLREFFDHDWNAHSDDMGRIMEPGHQFEWAWLLAGWSGLRHNQIALNKAKRLFDIGETYGTCERRKVAVMSLNDDFTIRDSLARLWPQTEWIKASVRLASMSHGEERARYFNSALRATVALKQFLGTPISGLWYDKWPEDREMIDEPAPASTFYHIVCAIYEANHRIIAMKRQD